MKRVLIVGVSLVLASGCLSPVDPEAVRSAEVYFPPKFRYVKEARYCFSAAERERAVQECKKLGADTLFEFVIDSAGKVRKARIVRTSQPPDRAEDIVGHARVMVFSPDASSEMYRSFYFPTHYTYTREFEWMNR